MIELKFILWVTISPNLCCFISRPLSGSSLCPSLSGILKMAYSVVRFELKKDFFKKKLRTQALLENERIIKIFCYSDARKVMQHSFLVARSVEPNSKLLIFMQTIYPAKLFSDLLYEFILSRFYLWESPDVGWLPSPRFFLVWVLLNRGTGVVGNPQWEIDIMWHGAKMHQSELFLIINLEKK